MPVALDTETNLATDEQPIPTLVSVAVASGPSASERWLFATHDPNALEAVVWAIREGWIVANGPFDAFVVLRRWPHLLPLILEMYQRGAVYDVLTREKLIDNAEGMFWRRGPYNLGAVAKRRAGIIVDKESKWRLRYGELLGLEISQWPEEARAYALDDATGTWVTWYAQEVFRSQHSLDVLADAARQARAHLALHAQTLVGIHRDAAAVADLDARIEAMLEARKPLLFASGLARMGGTKKAPKLVKTKAAAQVMFEATATALGLPIPRTKPSKKFPDGQVSVTDDEIGKLNLPPNHPLRAFQEYGSLQSLQSKNITPFRHPIVRCRYDELIATGRTSASAPGEPWHGTNLQNLPRPDTLRDMGLACLVCANHPARVKDCSECKGSGCGPGFRECLVAPPGCVFVTSDFSGAELVALAQVQLDKLGRSTLAEVLRQNRDPHAELGARILGVPIEAFDKKGNPEHKQARQLAKVPNFGYPGGLGPKRFVDFARTQYGVILTEARARQLKRMWMAQWPEMKDYFAWVESCTGLDGRITMLQIRSNRIRGGCGYTDACNTPYQGLAADAAKDALWHLFLAQFDPASPLHGCPQVLFVHDENVTVCPIDRAESVRVEQERIMIEAFGRWCPDVPISIESTISPRYGK